MLRVGKVRSSDIFLLAGAKKFLGGRRSPSLMVM